MALVEVLIAIFAIIGVYVLIQERKKRKFIAQFPGPPKHILLGNALDMTSPTVTLDVFSKYKREHGGMVSFQIGPIRQGLIVSDYKFVEWLLSTNVVLSKTDNYRFLTPWLGTGLLISDGIKWKKNRKIITPAFHFKILEQFVEVFESAGAIMIEKLKKKSGEASLNIYPYITLCALDIICETAMGVPVNAQQHEDSEYVRSVKDMCRILVDRTMSPTKMIDIFFYFTKDYQVQKKALKVLHDFTNKVIAQKQKALKNHTEEAVDDVGIKKRKAFLDLLLETMNDGQKLTLEEIREEVDTFMFEGHDTTATAMTFILYCIANHPEVQAEIVEEQKRIFGNDLNATNVTYASLQDMKYLEAVIKEGLRLYPSVPLIGRETKEEAEYYGGKIPAGIGFIVFIYGMLRDPEFFPEPEKFDPTRYDRMDGKSPYSYIPFSAGPRNCIGQKFAMAEMKSTISKVVRNFELYPAVPYHTLELSAETVLKSANGVKIGLKIRNN